MKKLFITFLFSLVCGMAFASEFGDEPAKSPQPWESSPTLVLDIKWHRTTGLPFVEDGVCHLVYLDDFRSTLDADIMKQVRFCAEKGAAKKAGDPLVAGTQRVQLYEVDTQEHMWDKVIDLYGGTSPYHVMPPMCAYKSCMKSTVGWSSGVFKYVIGGVYVKRENYCGIVLAYDAAFGHEFKHCVDGLFHDNHGRWIQK